MLHSHGEVSPTQVSCCIGPDKQQIQPAIYCYYYYYYYYLLLLILMQNRVHQNKANNGISYNALIQSELLHEDMIVLGPFLLQHLLFGENLIIVKRATCAYVHVGRYPIETITNHKPHVYKWIRRAEKYRVKNILIANFQSSTYICMYVRTCACMVKHNYVLIRNFGFKRENIDIQSKTKQLFRH